VLIDGEEEIGSPHLAELLDKHGTPVDLVLYSDTLLWHADHPAVCLTVRGGLNAELKLYGPDCDLHSGAVSGAAPNPVHELCRVVARLHDEQGRVTLPGFYDRVTQPSPRTRAQLAALPYDDADWLARSDTHAISGEAGFTVLERLWARPTLEVISILAGDPVGPSRGAIPAAATASLSIRTVDEQRTDEVAEQLRRWVAGAVDQQRFRYELIVAEETAQEPYRTPDDHPAVALLAEAMSAGFGGRPAGRMGNAGGGPAALLAERLDAPVLFFGTGLPQDAWHGNDESVSVEVLLAGSATLADFWSRLGGADGVRKERTARA
jgi:acetylornithine deacetylase/succinyl-diaminopimelate desuccinylase-like protein